MDYFIDTEFCEDGTTIDLISIGIVCPEESRELYAVSTEARLDRVSNWVRMNVLPALPPYGDPAWMSRNAIRAKVHEFVRVDPKPRFWAYYADYDWVALCQLFGTMMQLPEHFPKYCMDLKQLSVMAGSPQHPPHDKGEHTAIVDAWWNVKLYRFLIKHLDDTSALLDSWTIGRLT